MTQKELLYVEDAIEHEKCLISILEDMTNTLKDKELVEFTKREIKTHQKEEKDLCKLLEGKLNE